MDNSCLHAQKVDLCTLSNTITLIFGLRSLLWTTMADNDQSSHNLSLSLSLTFICHVVVLSQHHGVQCNKRKVGWVHIKVIINCLLQEEDLPCDLQSSIVALHVFISNISSTLSVLCSLSLSQVSTMKQGFHSSALILALLLLLLSCSKISSRSIANKQGYPQLLLSFLLVLLQVNYALNN